MVTKLKEKIITSNTVTVLYWIFLPYACLGQNLEVDCLKHPLNGVDFRMNVAFIIVILSFYLFIIIEVDIASLELSNIKPCKYEQTTACACSTTISQYHHSNIAIHCDFLSFSEMIEIKIFLAYCLNHLLILHNRALHFLIQSWTVMIIRCFILAIECVVAGYKLE